MTGESTETVAIIPARGGSKGVPGKNLRVIAGLPLVARAIKTAQAATLVNRVVVSTDDPEIGSVSKQYGADVVWRPADISGDLASSEQALLHTLDQLEAKENYHPDLTVFLQCTAPLATSHEVDGTINAVLDRNADTGLAVVPFHYFLWKESASGDAVGINHEKRVRKLRQEQDPQFLEAGSIYVMRTSAFRTNGHRFFGKTALYVMPTGHRIEIDDETDIEIANTLLVNREERSAIDALPSPTTALVMDFDGVITDNRVLVSKDGTEAVLTNREDEIGIEALKDIGVKLLVLTEERNRILEAHCRKLRIPYLQGVDYKLEELMKWFATNHIHPANAVYVGNNVDCMQTVGCGVTVADGHLHAKTSALIILNSLGGRGAVHELADLIITGNGELNSAHIS